MMLYPRAFAIAETGWSPAARKDYPDFERRAAAFSSETPNSVKAT